MEIPATSDADPSLTPLSKAVDEPSEPVPPSRTRKRKRVRKLSVEPTGVRPLKKQRLLKRNGISLPWRDRAKYDEAVQRLQIFPIPPLAHTAREYATRKRLLNVVVLGVADTNIIEKLVADREGVWQVPKVTLEFKRIAYKRKRQPYTEWSRDFDGPPVSPSTTPVTHELVCYEHEDTTDNGEILVFANSAQNSTAAMTPVVVNRRTTV